MGALTAIVVGLACMCALAVVGLLAAPSAFAGGGAWWHVTSGARPTDLQPGAGEIVVTAANVGEGDADGEAEPVQIADSLPAGLQASTIEAVAGGRPGAPPGQAQCSLQTLSCAFAHDLPTFDEIEVRIGVTVAAGAVSGAGNEVTVSGGEAPAAHIARAIAVSAGPTPMGIQSYELAGELLDGVPDTQAGVAPLQETFDVTLNQTAEGLPVALPKDLRLNLPLGLTADFPRWQSCSPTQFYASPEPACASVGWAIATLSGQRAGAPEIVSVPVYGIEPDRGEAGLLGFMLPGRVPVLLDAEVNAGDGYAMTWTLANISQVSALLGLQVVIGGSAWNQPTSCVGGQVSTVEVDPWSSPGSFLALSSEPLPALHGCEQLPFAPAASVVPDVRTAATPTGVAIEIRRPDRSSASGAAEADVEDASVLLPPGMTFNPAGSEGLEECTPAQFGAAASVQPYCPDASKLGTVQIRTPLASNPLEGAVFAGNAGLDTPLTLYVAVEDPVSGVIVKTEGTVSRDPVTRQLTVSLANLPPIPIEALELDFFGGPRGVFETPPLCGSYPVAATFIGGPELPNAEGFSAFTIDSGPSGLTCQEAEAAFYREIEEEEKDQEDQGLLSSAPPEEPYVGGSGGLALLLPSDTGGAAAFKAGGAAKDLMARLATTTLKVSSRGTVDVEILCPATNARCSGSIALRTNGAIAAKSRAKRTEVTLAAGHFDVAAGKTATIELHLSADGRTLLQRVRHVRATATVTARDSAGIAQSTKKTVTLRVASRPHELGAVAPRHRSMRQFLNSGGHGRVRAGRRRHPRPR